MARIRKFIRGDRDAKAPQSKSEIDGYVQKVTDADGTTYVYLYNYKAGGPDPGDSPTQSTHFGLRAAREFVGILEETFGAGELRNRTGYSLTTQTLAALRAFVSDRDWDQFHTPENLAKSISIEASELLELYQWGGTPDQGRVEEELADVVTYCIHLANKLGVDLDEIVMNKLAKSAEKYPVELAKGSMKKYTELHE